jgi:hypothetical protein
MGEAYQYTFFNPEDLADYKPKLYALINAADDDKSVSFFQQVRPSPEHDWNWYLSAAKIFMRDENGRPTHLIVTASPVDPKHHVLQG